MQMCQPAAASERRARRRKTFYPTSMQLGGGEHRVHLLDLSTSGALVHGDAAPCTGAVVLVALGTGTRAARVMWVDGSRFGLAFVIPFPDAQFAALTAELGIGA